MCIRDRLITVEKANIGLLSCCGIYYLIRNNILRVEEYYKSCLLYTSDAADERSSVDLGGRRIIKKKKKVEYCERSNINKHKNTEETIKHEKRHYHNKN